MPQLSFRTLDSHPSLAKEVVNLPQGINVFGTVEAWSPFDTPKWLGLAKNLFPKTQRRFLYT